MLSKSMAFYSLLSVSTMMLCSCGANKKLEASRTEIAQLQTENGQLKEQINSMQKDLGQLKAANQSMTEEHNKLAADYSSYKTSCEKTKEEYQEMNAAMMEMADETGRLQERLDSAMRDFESRGVEVYAKDRVIYVSMEDKLLYKSGSAALGAEGKKALATLASVLNDYPRLKVTVVGNTDTMHVKGIADNWSLSTERANGVVRILSKDYNVDPARLTAAGKGKFSPVANNSTEAGRAKNRRTDIVLNPDWDRLFHSVEKQ
ncbi:MAG TPA: OmpA family protein [Chitinophagaceae bacterium]|nr:OmpA family protein [Chitinophagaceae bacterium]